MIPLQAGRYIVFVPTGISLPGNRYSVQGPGYLVPGATNRYPQYDQEGPEAHVLYAVIQVRLTPNDLSHAYRMR